MKMCTRAQNTSALQANTKSISCFWANTFPELTMHEMRKNLITCI